MTYIPYMEELKPNHSALHWKKKTPSLVTVSDILISDLKYSTEARQRLIPLLSKEILK